MAKCEHCGEVFTKKQLKKHLESEHGIAPEPIKEEPKIETPKAEEAKAPEVPAVVEEPKPESKPEPKPFIPEVGMKVWHRRLDLQKAFPHPQDEKCAYAGMPNFLAWMVRFGVKEEPEIAAYFKAQQGGK